MRIKEYREAKGLTQKELAEKIGIKENVYSRKEGGKRAFKVEELLKLEIILGASISELFADIKKGI